MKVKSDNISSKIKIKIVLDYPDRCMSFKGPHIISCYHTIWIEAGCIIDGFDYQNNFDLANFRELNLQ